MAFFKCCIYFALFVYLVTGAMLHYRQYEEIFEKANRERIWQQDIIPKIKPRASSLKWSEKAIDASNNSLKQIDRSPLTAQQLDPK